MNRVAIIALLPSLIAGCSWGSLALRDLGRDRADQQVSQGGEVITLQPSLGLHAPPQPPEPMQSHGGIGDATFRSDQAKGLEGDKDAAFRVALMFREGSNGVPRDENKMLRWLRHASELENGNASYQLYLHYLNRGLDRDAVRYENRALRQGFIPPPRLDARRG